MPVIFTPLRTAFCIFLFIVPVSLSSSGILYSELCFFVWLLKDLADIHLTIALFSFPSLLLIYLQQSVNTVLLLCTFIVTADSSSSK